MTYIPEKDGTGSTGSGNLGGRMGGLASAGLGICCGLGLTCGRRKGFRRFF